MMKWATLLTSAWTALALLARPQVVPSVQLVAVDKTVFSLKMRNICQKSRLIWLLQRNRQDISLAVVVSEMESRVSLDWYCIYKQKLFLKLILMFLEMLWKTVVKMFKEHLSTSSNLALLSFGQF